MLLEQLYRAWSSEYFFAYGLELPSQLPEVICAGDKEGEKAFVSCSVTSSQCPK